MKYIEDIRDGDSILGHYFCREKQTLKTKAGKTYLSLTLADKTGTIDGKVWELSNSIQSFDSGDYIKIDAIANTYQNEIQLKISKIRKSLEGEYLSSDYIPTINKDIESIYAEFTGYIKTISNPFLRRMLENIFIKNTDIAAKFKNSTAAKTFHHSYVGGLLEHSLSVTETCDFFSTRYKYINRDILISAAMLHDIGKIWEIAGFPENEYTDSGQLIGHVVMGTELVTKAAAEIPDFPENIKNLLKHCILSHHGEFEYGSPKIPSIIEAFILYYCDNMDAKIFSFIETIEKNNTPGSWVGYNKMLGRNIRKTE